MSYWVKITLVALTVSFIGMTVGFSYPVTKEEMERKFIVENPLNLSQIDALSQYRSCAGHDFRGPSLTGKTELSPRSLKHYVKVKQKFRGTINQVNAFAPFDGEISVIDEDLGGPTDQQIWLTPSSKSPRQWQFVFFHINLDPALHKGSKVVAGQKIGTANLARGPEGSTDNFDIAVKFTRPLHRPAIDAPMHHMSSGVLAEYEQYGLNAEKLIIPEKVRDANDCPVLPKGEGGDGPDIYFPPEAGAKEYLFLRAQ
ncbi:MAG: hypothetical protein HZA94_02040 [Candidatus Vogelbacteria bacterium]|nr:hypothetical protein [Candidatus Vogelbacteria bacterium]